MGQMIRLLSQVHAHTAWTMRPDRSHNYAFKIFENPSQQIGMTVALENKFVLYVLTRNVILIVVF
jgi:hypothetical protein